MDNTYKFYNTFYEISVVQLACNEFHSSLNNNGFKTFNEIEYSEINIKATYAYRPTIRKYLSPISEELDKRKLETSLRELKL